MPVVLTIWMIFGARLKSGKASQWRERERPEYLPVPEAHQTYLVYKPEEPPAIKDESEDEGVEAANETPQELRQEVLRLTDALTAAQHKIKQSEEDFRRERVRHDHDVDDYERRLRLKDQRIAYLEERVKELEPASPETAPMPDVTPSSAPMPDELPEPTLVPMPDVTPEPVQEETRHRLADRKRPLAEIKDLETRSSATAWRGRVSLARQIRADYLAHFVSPEPRADFEACQTIEHGGNNRPRAGGYPSGPSRHQNHKSRRRYLPSTLRSAF